MALPVYVLNRDQDSERLAMFSASARQHGIDFQRITAFDGHAEGAAFADHADLVGAHFWGAPEAKPGAIGCFLSHRRAWQAVLDHGDAHALICEDDTAFFEDLARLHAMTGAPMPFDIVFANARLAAWCAAVCDGERLGLGDVVARLAALGGPTAKGLKSTPGGDCYLLSASGAKRLLALTEAQRMVCGVDWAMVWNGLGRLDRTAANAFPELGILRQHLPVADRPLEALVLSRPVGGQSGKVPSTIRHRVTRPIGDLLARQAP